MMRKKAQRRSNCPISFGLDIFGDKWSLLVLRDMTFFGKTTYGEFLASDEGIATNILADRLKTLEHAGIIKKKDDAYALTKKGQDLMPVLVEMAAWGVTHDPQTPLSQDYISLLRKDPTHVRRTLSKKSNS